jgi:hypothetical protein
VPVDGDRRLFLEVIAWKLSKILENQVGILTGITWIGKRLS